MKQKIALAITVVAFTVALTTPAVSQLTDSESSDFNVTVNEQLAVDVAPDTLVYSGNPGSYNSSSDSGYTQIEIENLGSENITNIYLTSTNPSDNPFGTGRAEDYDAGNFIQIDPTNELNEIVDSASTYAFVDRKDYNETNDLSYVQEPTSGQGDTRYGRARVANESFFWLITNSGSGGSSNGCDGGALDSEIWVGKEAHSNSQTGSVDFRDSTNYWVENITQSDDGSSNYGQADDVPLFTYKGTVNYTVFTWCGQADDASSDNTTHVYFQRWNVESPDNGATIGDITDSLERILNPGTQDEELQPGEHFSLNTRVAIPDATAEGDVSQGQLTVKVDNAGT